MSGTVNPDAVLYTEFLKAYLRGMLLMSIALKSVASCKWVPQSKQ